VVARKIGSLFFSPKTSFLTHFLPKTSRKHPIDLIKPINDHQKANKPPQNPLGLKNSSRA